VDRERDVELGGQRLEVGAGRIETRQRMDEQRPTAIVRRDLREPQRDEPTLDLAQRVRPDATQLELPAPGELDEAVAEPPREIAESLELVGAQLPQPDSEADDEPVPRLHRRKDAWAEAAAPATAAHRLTVRVLLDAEAFGAGQRPWRGPGAHGGLPDLARSEKSLSSRCRVRELLVIGIGLGNPEHLTLQAIEALRRVDVFFVMDKGPAKTDLNELRKNLCKRHAKAGHRVVELPDSPRDPAIDSYPDRVAAWHEQRVQRYAERLGRELGSSQCGGVLAWGDPSLYDSTVRLVEELVRRGTELDYRVIPGISSVQALAASHRIALNRVGGSIHVTTGRRLAAALREGHDDIVVLLDGENSWKAAEGRAFEIYWAAYLGMPHERLVKGLLAEVGAEIECVRAALRAEHGWIMDTYLLRRVDRAP
jgi:precorrin-6A synthase